MKTFETVNAAFGYIKTNSNSGVEASMNGGSIYFGVGSMPYIWKEDATILDRSCDGVFCNLANDQEIKMVLTGLFYAMGVLFLDPDE